MAALSVAAGYTPAAVVAAATAAHKLAVPAAAREARMQAAAGILAREGEVDAGRKALDDERVKLIKELRDSLKISQAQVAESRAQEVALEERLQQQTDRHAAEKRVISTAMNALREEISSCHNELTSEMCHHRSRLSQYANESGPVCIRCTTMCG